MAKSVRLRIIILGRYAMNTTGNDLAKQGQNFADKAADKVQTGIQSARQTGAEVSDKLSSAVETARTQAGPSIEKAADQAQTLYRQGVDSAKAAAQSVRDSAAQTSESIVTFTKENPVKAILIAAASGALLITLFNALYRPRD
jgi:ElaB/YqjD/DUF883 family membrane-anchored ribosome-binding protein